VVVGGTGVAVGVCEVGVGDVEEDPVFPTGMDNTWSIMISPASLRLLASMIASTVVPYSLAIPLSVSPATTMWVRNSVPDCDPGVVEATVAVRVGRGVLALADGVLALASGVLAGASGAGV